MLAQKPSLYDAACVGRVVHGTHRRPSGSGKRNA
ncbi:hypothetical protein [Sodalis-like endosymbiont of Proechinophthirus fluctus]|nr:hypothetical protein [Sodalis-like endosymbiont of Proechinophthirus fluctus]